MMIHYHGTPCSGTGLDSAKFLAGRHALVPFAYQRSLPVALDVCQSVVLDNSAYTNWRRGHGGVDVPAYHSWVQSLAGHPVIDWCLIPDKIDGTEKDNVELVNHWLRMGCRMHSVPVWHLHESLDWLDYLVSNFQRVSLGSSGEWSDPGTPKWWQRMADVMRVACDKNGSPRAKLHGLRMLDPAIFSRLPLASADSTNAAVNAGSVKRFGVYPSPTAGQRANVIADRIEAHQSAHFWDSDERQGVFALVQP
jgi:hypothetical protein